MHRRWWQELIAVTALVALAVPRVEAGDVAGCCRCTGCPSPQQFACRAALDTTSCDTVCENLGCTVLTFMAGTECADVAECYGDCCDNADVGCSQVPQANCTGGQVFIANAFCDASSCLPPPPTATITETATVTDTPTVTASATPSTTATASATPSDTPLPSATATATSVATPTLMSTATASASATVVSSPTATPTPSSTEAPSFTPTATVPVSDAFEWIIDETEFTPNLPGIPTAGASYRQPPDPPNLQLHSDQARFCQEAGLLPILRLDVPSDSCENDCLLGIFPIANDGSTVNVARLPALNRAGGTFDLLVTTPLGCVPGSPTTTVRMPNAVSYVSCIGDCDGSGAADVSEVTRGIAAALGLVPVSDCRANDGSGDGVVTIDELVTAVGNLLEGCPSL